MYSTCNLCYLFLGERRIRVHTLCLPVSDQPAQIYAGLNIAPIAGVLVKMGADRLNTASLGDARDVSVCNVGLNLTF